MCERTNYKKQQGMYGEGTTTELQKKKKKSLILSLCYQLEIQSTVPLARICLRYWK